MDLPGSVAVVTWAGSGIRRAVSVAFFDAGYRAVLAGLMEDDVVATPQGYEPNGLVVPIAGVRQGDAPG